MNELPHNKGLIYEFGKFVLDPQERVLLADGEPVHLGDKVFDTLCLLIQNNGKLLTKDEMMASIWEETFVEEGNLAKNVSRLRKILNTGGAQMIETIPRRGYRFRADVKHMDAATDMLVHRRLRIKLTHTTQNGTSDTPESKLGLEEIHSIAVLPFQPLDSHADDVFGLGLTDALITQMNRGGQVQVRPTSSILKYNNIDHDPILAGRELQADAVLDGRYQRVENKLRLTVQLMRTSDGESLWADGFNTEVQDIFTVQELIAESVISSLTKKLTAEALARIRRRYTENAEAYGEYMRGRVFWNKRTATGYDTALECFQKAIEIDPAYALAYAGIADIYNLRPLYDGYEPHEYFPKAKAAALKALFIDGNLAEAHAALGLAILHYDWNWSGAEVSFQNAIKMDPGYAAAYQLLGVYLLRVNRLSEALIALKKARELDPLSPINAVWLAEVLRYCGETDASIGLHLETLESFPDFYLAHYHLAFSYIDSGQFEAAEFHRERAVSLSHENSLTLSLQGILQSALGNKPAVQETLNKLLQMKAEKYISSANIASVYSASGNEEKAIEWLETALEERDPNLTWIKFDKEFEFLAPNPRFQKILREVGLAEKKAEISGKTVSAKRRWKPILVFGILSAVIIAALGFYFWKGGETALGTETGVLRLTADPREENHPRWTNDGRIRFLRSGTDKQVDSVIMNADGSNQAEIKDFNSLDYGVWSPDGSSVIFVKQGEPRAFYLAGADGSNEVRLPFFGGNFAWSSDNRKIVYQEKVNSDDSEIFVYSLDTAKSENVTNNPAFDADPSFAPDGKQIVFASLRDGNAEIYLMNADGGNVRRLTTHPSWDNHPVFSPDGTAIAFNGNRDNESGDVYLMNADGSGVRRLTDWKANEGVDPGCWSPDGTQIAFTSDLNGKDDIFTVSAEIFRPQLVLADERYNLQFPSYSPGGKTILFQAETVSKSGELSVFDPESKRSRILLKTENADISPAFSPDGEWIVFQNRIDSNTEICLIKKDGSGFMRLTDNAARDTNPVFSPDGTRIAFSSNRDGNYGSYNLYLMNTDGGDQRRIYASKVGMSVSPSWSPDGGEIVFANDKEDGASGNFEIFKIHVGAHEAEQRLTFRSRYDGQPAVSPDGKKIAFTSNTDGNSEIYLMNSDGTGLLRITRNPAEDNSPQFSKDGKKIIFSSNRGGKYAIYEIDMS